MKFKDVKIGQQFSVALTVFAKIFNSCAVNRVNGIHVFAPQDNVVLISCCKKCVFCVPRHSDNDFLICDNSKALSHVLKGYSKDNRYSTFSCPEFELKQEGENDV